MASTLGLIGLALQLVGALVALHGLVKTHDANADKTVRTLAAERSAKTRQLVRGRLDRLLRRRRGVVVHAGTAHLTGSGSVSARGVIGYPPIGDEVHDRDAIRLLDQRVRELLERVQKVDHAQQDAAAATTAELAALREGLQEVSEQSAAIVRRSAIEGLTQEAFGLVIVIVGGLVQAWAAFV